MINCLEELGTWVDPEGSSFGAGPVVHEILEGNLPKEVCQRYRQKHIPGEAYVMTPNGGVRLQVHKKFWQ